jgi:hypothetical protein
MDSSELIAELQKMYFHRLRIEILSSGLTFTEDLRDWKEWMKECNDKRINTVMVEIDDGEVVEKIRGVLVERGHSDHDIARIMEQVKGRV